MCCIKTRAMLHIRETGADEARQQMVELEDVDGTPLLEVTCWSQVRIIRAHRHNSISVHRFPRRLRSTVGAPFFSVDGAFKASCGHGVRLVRGLFRLLRTRISSSPALENCGVRSLEDW